MQDPCNRARCPVVAKRVKEAATAAVALSEGELGSEASQKEDAELVGREAELVAGRQDSEGPASVGAALREHQGARRVVQLSEKAVKLFVVPRIARDALPPTGKVAEFEVTALLGAQAVREVLPGGGAEGVS